MADRILKLNQKYEQLSGKPGLQYVYHPTDTTTCWVFAGGVRRDSKEGAIKYLLKKIAECKH